MLNSQELLYLLYIELGILLLVVSGFVLWRWRRKKRQSAGEPAVIDLGGGSSAQTEDPQAAYLQDEIRKTTEKLEQVGTNSPEATVLHEACEFRLRVLQGELEVLLSGEDEKRYWAQIADYFDGINREFNARLHALQGQIDAYLEKIDSLQRFASGLKEKLAESKESISQLEQALTTHLGEENLSDELKSLMGKLEQDKQALESQLEVAENEVTAMMENVALLRKQAKSDSETAPADGEPPRREAPAGDDTPPSAEEVALLKEENEFLCNQIAMLLKEEVSHNDEVAELREELSEKLQTLEAENRQLKEKLEAVS